MSLPSFAAGSQGPKQVFRYTRPLISSTDYSISSRDFSIGYCMFSLASAKDLEKGGFAHECYKLQGIPQRGRRNPKRDLNRRGMQINADEGPFLSSNFKSQGWGGGKGS
jgi:hypothetical protein